MEVDADHAAAASDGIELVVREVAGGGTERVDRRVGGHQRSVDELGHIPESPRVEMGEVEDDA